MTLAEYNNFRLVHRLSKRIRVIIPGLKRDPERLHVLAILLNKREGVVRVRVVAAIASITVSFDPDELPADNLLLLLDTVIHNLGQKSGAVIQAMQRVSRPKDQHLRDDMFGIGGMSCSSCALFLEMLLQRQPDVVNATVNYLAETVRIQSYLPQQQLMELIAENGYEAYPIDSLTQRKLLLELEGNQLYSARVNLNILTALNLPVVVLSLLAKRSRTLLLLQVLLVTPVVLWGGRDIFKKALTQAKLGTASMDSLIALGVSASYLYSLPALVRPNRHVYFDAAAAIIEFVLLGRYLEARAKSKMVQDIRKLVNLQPQTANVLQGKEEKTVSVDKIAVGDILLIRPGERIPVDGVVLKGLSTVDEANIKGTSISAIKERGQQVFEGSLNGGGVLRIKATAIGKETLLSGLIHMVDQAQNSKLIVQKTVDQWASLLVPGVIVLSGATFGFWVLRGEVMAHALANAIAVMLISCPCALGLATPAATMVGSGRAARRGIYIRNGEALEHAATIDTVIFDKTGTLTEGNPQVTEFINVSPNTDYRLIQLAASAELNSAHILGQAIVRHAREIGVDFQESSRFFSTPDQGIRVEVDGQQLLLGNQAWMLAQEVNIEALQTQAKRLSQQGYSLVFVAVDQQVAGLFALTDTLRSDALKIINSLKRLQIKLLLVTGDNDAVAQGIAEQVGIETVMAEVGPAEKLNIIRKLQQQGYRVAMVGDGVNDAPALAAADVSLVIDCGAGVAIASADLVLLNGDISRVEDAIMLSRETRLNVRQNLCWAFAYNLVAVPVAMAGKLTPSIASAAMALSSVSVVVNSLRLNNKP